ncbi:glutamate--tRNA ligase [Candidatus Finniella inopinata]|uniref:Glutamate--tRNA ligase n=1 Tax=Candidatus Finniella inopinata TaxID=1696036 RepID=A0A4Q7DJ53_9PROT|nr:glutamate--tRNA ligase [Candidatus Finniella inopinata]RZI47021.1 glutamate--tRNA ligase [Candidatus Finniella inopinata]
MTVKVRFAPSPTGLLHIGNARAALINWLFAHRHGGHFMLRLDDTDLERSEERFAQALQTDLAWLGLHRDSFAKQSDRFDRYNQAVQDLIQSRRLYPCYETPEELDFKRKRQLAKGEPPIYDRAALKLTPDEKKAFEDQGRKPHWRFQLEPGVVKWHDLVRGDVEFHSNHLSDPVLVRADGAYLYTLTSVVDDIDFAITHILRGEDHVTNTAVQIQLFTALNNNQPVNITFGHTTLLMDAKGQALSKRLGSLSLQTLRESGIEPMAINSLLARLGTSLPTEPCLTLDTLASHFNLETFSRTPPRFDEAELEHLNHKLFQIMPYDQVKDRLGSLKAGQVTEAVWAIIRGNLHTLNDVEKWQEILFGDFDQPVFSTEDQGFLKLAVSHLPDGDWNQDTWGQWTQQLKELTDRKGKTLFMPLRQALTGLDHGPEMKELLPLIGYDRTKARLEKKPLAI